MPPLLHSPLREMAVSNHPWRIISGAVTMVVLVSVLMFTTAWRTPDRDNFVAQQAEAQQREAAAASAIHTPAIVEVSSKALTARPDPQPLTIKGRELAPGLTATITSPHEVMTTFGPESVTNLTDTTCTLPARLDERGSYLLVVRNRGGQRSNIVTFTVK